jgi:hypothetical protein
VDCPGQKLRSSGSQVQKVFPTPELLIGKGNTPRIRVNPLGRYSSKIKGLLGSFKFGRAVAFQDNPQKKTLPFLLIQT